MNLTGGFNAQLSPDATHTAIDEAMWQEFTRTKNPGYLSASDSFFFKQGSTVGNAFVYDEDSNVGAFDATNEQEEILGVDAFIGNQETVFSQKYTKRVVISDEAFRADQIGKRQQIGRQIAERAQMTQDKMAILNTYGDAFAGSVFTTPDGQALASNSHTTLKGATVDNLETGSLTPDNLWTLVNSLATQLGQDGDPGSHLFEGIVTNFTLYKAAREVMNSTQLANSVENNVNVFDTDYGQVRIVGSVFLNSGTAYNAATNAATSYHVLGRNHQITRKVFYGMTTYMTSPENTTNDCYVLTAKYHETAFPGTWTAYAASNGTT